MSYNGNHTKSLSEPARYKGGHTQIGHGGYILEYCPGHPACSARGMVLQHRLVVEVNLKRFLGGKEVVHHIDGNILNNDYENLLVFPDQKAHIEYHFVQRWKDKVEYFQKAAQNPEIRVSDLPYAPGTVLKICKKFGIEWKSRTTKGRDAEVLRVLKANSRKQAVKILGISLQSLWNNYPHLMRMTANPKRLKSDGHKEK